MLDLVLSKMKALAEDTDAKAEEMLVRFWRAASPREKLARLLDANRTARNLALAGLSQRHPLESEARLRRRFSDLWLGPKLAAKAYGPLFPHE